MYDATAFSRAVVSAFHLQSRRTLVSHFFRQTVSVSRLVMFEVHNRALNLSVREIGGASQVNPPKVAHRLRRFRRRH